MMKRISASGDVNYVIVYQLSRLNRNRIDDALVMLQMDAAGVRLISATENIDESPAGQMTRGILAAINQYRSVSEGEDIARKLAHKARLGGTIGQAKLGYVNIKEEVEGRKVSAVAFDTQRAPLIKQGFELYATGDYSVRRLAQVMSDRGLTSRATRQHPRPRTVSANTWHRILNDPYYIGVIRFKGELFPARHEPLIPRDLFALVQEIYKERSAPTRRDRTHFHYLKKQLYCGRCYRAGRSNKLVYTVAKGQYEYYVCLGRQTGACDLPHLPTELVEDHVVRYYDTLGLSQDFVTEVTMSVRDAVRDEQSTLGELQASIQTQLAELDKREERLIDLAEDGFPQQKIRDRLAAIRADRVRIESDSAKSSAALEVGAQALAEAMRLIEDVARLYREGTDHSRSLLNDAFFKRLYVDEAGVDGQVMREPVREIVEADRVHAAPSSVPASNENSPSGPRNKGVLRARGAAPTLSDVLIASRVNHPRSSSKAQLAEDRGFEPLRAVNPTRFPSERHRPLGESSAGEATRLRPVRGNRPRGHGSTSARSSRTTLDSSPSASLSS